MEKVEVSNGLYLDIGSNYEFRYKRGIYSGRLAGVDNKNLVFEDLILHAVLAWAMEGDYVPIKIGSDSFPARTICEIVST